MCEELDLLSATIIYSNSSDLGDTCKAALNLPERLTLYGKRSAIVKFGENIDILSIQIDEIILY